MIECQKCGFLNPDGTEFCKNPAGCAAFLGYDAKRIAALPGTVQLTVSTAALAVVPGALATLEVRVRNKSNIVDQYDIEVVGEAAAWAVVQPSTLSLFPDKEGAATVQMRPPRSSSVPAGRKGFVIKVQSKASPEISSAQDAAIEVGPFLEATASIAPRTARSGEGANYRLLLQNKGNAPLELAVEGSDPDELLSFEFDRPAVALGPGESSSVQLAVRPRSTFYDGPPQPHTFKVQATAPGAGPAEAEATYLQDAVQRPVPRKVPWLPVALALLLLAVLTAGVIERDPLMKLAGFASSPTSNPNTGGTASPSAPSSPSQTGSPTATPTPTASATQLALVTVPNVTCMTEQAAQQALGNAGLIYVPSFTSSTAYPRGIVFKTQPLAGGTAPRGSEVTAFVSTGPTVGSLLNKVNPCLVLHLPTATP